MPAPATLRDRFRSPLVTLVLCLVVLVAVLLAVSSCRDGSDDAAATAEGSSGDASPPAAPAGTDAGPATEGGSAGSPAPASPGGATEAEGDGANGSQEPPAAPLTEYDGWVDPASSGRPWSDLGAGEGLLTFRGNPTRSWYGTGPVPDTARVLWSWKVGCSNSSVGGEAKNWCGSGWTGQPTVFHPPAAPDDWWVAFGGYNRSVNFLDPDTGTPAFPSYATGDIIKGSVTIDPDGFPLLYTGSRDNFFHVVALDRPQPTALWKLSADAHKPTKWNNDWDGNALIIDDYLFEGGENSRFYIVKLNRAYDAQGKVTVDPQVVFTTEAWDDQLLRDVGDNDVSVESSVAITGNVVYFANSGGLIQGWDISGVKAGATPTQVFRFWTGDDTDATVVADGDGFLYVGSEYERGTSRSRELGQVFKLDPRNPSDPVVWSREANNGIDTGVWATPGLWRDLVIVPTDDGRVLAFDRATGADRWSLRLPGPLWHSPVIVDDVLIQGDCEGTLHAFDLGDGTTAPTERWSVELGGCIESTPAVWDGRIYVGTRSGSFFAVGA
jgi:hypothetical protein